VILDDSAVEIASLVVKRIVCSGYICYRMKCIKCGHEFDQPNYITEPAETKIRLECYMCGGDAPID